MQELGQIIFFGKKILLNFIDYNAYFPYNFKINVLLAKNYFIYHLTTIFYNLHQAPLMIDYVYLPQLSEHTID